MDIMTHMLIGYLFPFGLGVRIEPYLAISGLTAIIPDFDVAFFPLSRRIPALQHRTVTHNLLFMVSLALIVALLSWGVFGLRFEWAFLVAALGCGSHYLADLLTDFPIPPFWPFKRTQYCLNFERGINFGMFAFSLPMILILFNLRGTGLGAIVFDTLIVIAYLVVLGSITLRIIFRSILYYNLNRYLRSADGQRHLDLPADATADPAFKISILPSTTPLRWTIAITYSVPDRSGTKQTQIRLAYLRAFPWTRRFDRLQQFQWDDDSKPTAQSVDSVGKALGISYALVQSNDRFERFNLLLPHLEHTSTPQGDKWTVFWYPAGLLIVGRAYGLEVSIGDFSKPVTRIRYRKIERPGAWLEDKSSGDGENTTRADS